MQFLEKPWKMLENIEIIKLVTTEKRRGQLVSEPMFNTTKFKDFQY